MAVVQYSALVTQLRGKLGGSQFNKGHNVQTLQRKSTPTIRQTPAQLAQRQRISQAQRNWKLESPQRQAEMALVAQSNPVSNRLGAQVVLTPYNHYVKTQTARLIAGVSLTTNFTTIPLNAQTNVPSGFFIEVVGTSPVGTQVLSYGYQRNNVGTPTPSDASPRLFLYMRVMSPQGYKLPSSRWLLVHAFAGSNSNMFTSQFALSRGVYWAIGNTIELRVEVVHMGAGVVTGSELTSAILT